MRKNVIVNGRNLVYEFTVKHVKNINLRVKSDGSVSVSANKFVPEKNITDFVISKAESIFDAIDRFKSVSDKQRKNDCLKILGIERKIRVIQGKNSVVLSDNEIIVSTVDSNEKSADILIEKWKKQFFLSLCDTVCRKYFTYFEDKGFDYPEIRVRKMTSRWGSCIRKSETRQKGTVTFNLMLLSLPIECTELVVAHELSHFICRGHSADFYKVLLEVMPDYKQRKRLLTFDP